VLKDGEGDVGICDLDWGSAWHHTCSVLLPASLRAAACSATGLVPSEVRPPGRDRVAANSGVVYCSDCVSDIAPLLINEYIQVQKQAKYYETIPRRTSACLACPSQTGSLCTLNLEKARYFGKSVTTPGCMTQNGRATADFRRNLNLACQNYETTKEYRLLSVDERIILSGKIHKLDCEDREKIKLSLLRIK
jgi:hypothetical protein